MSLKVLGIGDNVCDKYLHTAAIYPGGNALNIAVFARELGKESAYLGTFGDDEVAFHVHDTVQSMGVDLSHCRYCIGENGCARAGKPGRNIETISSGTVQAGFGLL